MFDDLADFRVAERLSSKAQRRALYRLWSHSVCQHLTTEEASEVIQLLLKAKRRELDEIESHSELSA